MIFPNIIWLCEEITERKLGYDYEKFRNRLGDYTIRIENQEGDVYFLNDNEEEDENRR